MTIDRILTILLMDWTLNLGKGGRDWVGVCLTYFPFYQDTQLGNILQPFLQLGVTMSRILANGT